MCIGKSIFFTVWLYYILHIWSVPVKDIHKTIFFSLYLAHYIVSITFGESGLVIQLIRNWRKV